MNKKNKDSDTTIRISREIHEILEKESRRQKVSIKQLIAALVTQNYKKEELDKSKYSSVIEGIPNIEFNINKFNCKKVLKKINGIVSGAKEVYIKLALYLDTLDGRITMDISRFLNKNKLSKIHYYKKRSVILYPEDIMGRLKDTIKENKLNLLKDFLFGTSIYIKRETSPAMILLGPNITEDKDILFKDSSNEEQCKYIEKVYSIFLPSDKTLEEMKTYADLTVKDTDEIIKFFEFHELNEEEILSRVITAFINTNYKVHLEIVPACFGNKTYPLFEFIDYL